MNKKLLVPLCTVWFAFISCILYFIFEPQIALTERKKENPIHCPTGKGYGQMIYNEQCLSCKKNEKILRAPNGKGIYCCPKSANSLAWNGKAYQCCGDGFVSTVVPERDDSICCPEGTKQAYWIVSKGHLFYTCNE